MTPAVVVVVVVVAATTVVTTLTATVARIVAMVMTGARIATTTADTNVDIGRTGATTTGQEDTPVTTTAAMIAGTVTMDTAVETGTVDATTVIAMGPEVPPVATSATATIVPPSVILDLESPLLVLATAILLPALRHATHTEVRATTECPACDVANFSRPRSGNELKDCSTHARAPVEDH